MFKPEFLKVKLYLDKYDIHSLNNFLYHVINSIFIPFTFKWDTLNLSSIENNKINVILNKSPFYVEDPGENFHEITMRSCDRFLNKIFSLEDLIISEEIINYYTLSEKSSSVFKYAKNLTSIIIPVHNKFEYTRHCLESIFLNTSSDYELIIIDNNSTDETKDYLFSLKSNHCSEFCKRIKIVNNVTNMTFSQSNNIGSAYSKGETLVFLNNDTSVTKGWLEHLLMFKDEYPIIGPMLLYQDDTIQHCGTVFHKDFGTEHIFSKVSKYLPYANRLNNDYQSLTAAALLVFHDIFDMVEGFDESYENCYEDVDLCFKVRKLGYKILYNPNSIVYHFESKTRKATQGMEKSGKIFFDKWRNYYRADFDSFIKRAGFTIVDRQITIEDGILKNELLTLIAGKILNDVNFKRSLQDDVFRVIEPVNLKPLVSVIIPVYNNLTLTKNCLDSIYSNFEENIEIIVVDNGSDEDMCIFLKNYDRKCFSYIRNDKNLGFAIANNQGAKLAKGKYILCLNNDTIVTKGWISAPVRFLESNPSFGACGLKLLYEDNTIQHAGVVIYNEELLMPFHNLQNLINDCSVSDRLREFKAVTAAAVLIRSDLFNHIGGYNERYINCFEDIDLCFKIAEAGFKIIYFPNSIIYHLESKTKGRKDYVAYSAKIMRELWSSKVSSDAHLYYDEIGMILSIDHKTHSFIIDFKSEKLSAKLDRIAENCEKGICYESLIEILLISDKIGDIKNLSYRRIIELVKSLCMYKL